MPLWRFHIKTAVISQYLKSKKTEIKIFSFANEKTWFQNKLKIRLSGKKRKAKIYRVQETKEWYLISHLGSGRATVLELSHTGFDGRRASTGQTAKHIRSSHWGNNLWILGKAEKIFISTWVSSKQSWVSSKTDQFENNLIQILPKSLPISGACSSTWLHVDKLQFRSNRSSTSQYYGKSKYRFSFFRAWKDSIRVCRRLRVFRLKRSNQMTDKF